MVGFGEVAAAAVAGLQVCQLRRDCSQFCVIDPPHLEHVSQLLYQPGCDSRKATCCQAVPAQRCRLRSHPVSSGGHSETKGEVLKLVHRKPGVVPALSSQRACCCAYKRFFQSQGVVVGLIKPQTEELAEPVDAAERAGAVVGSAELYTVLFQLAVAKQLTALLTYVQIHTQGWAGADAGFAAYGGKGREAMQRASMAVSRVGRDSIKTCDATG